MKSILRTAAAGVALATFGIATGASAQTTASATADAEILSALSIEVTAADTLDFGTVALGNVAAPVNLTLAPGATAVTGCTTQVICGGSPVTPSFLIDGEAGRLVNITLPATVSLNSGTNSMQLGSLTTDLGGTQATLDSTTGQETFALGGTLTVSPTQAVGVYTGTINVSVAYN